MLPPMSSRGKENKLTNILKKANEKKMMDTSRSNNLDLRSLSKNFSGSNLLDHSNSGKSSPRDEMAESENKRRFNFRSKSPFAMEKSDNFSTADKTDTSEF